MANGNRNGSRRVLEYASILIKSDDFISMEEGETCLGLFYLGAFEGSMPTREPSDWREKVQWYD